MKMMWSVTTLWPTLERSHIRNVQIHNRISFNQDQLNTGYETLFYLGKSIAFRKPKLHRSRWNNTSVWVKGRHTVSRLLRSVNLLGIPEINFNGRRTRTILNALMLKPDSDIKMSSSVTILNKHRRMIVFSRCSIWRNLYRRIIFTVISAFFPNLC